MAKPPLGIEPEYIWTERRIHALTDAINRYIDAQVVYPPDWNAELFRHILTMRANFRIEFSGGIDLAGRITVARVVTTNG